MSNIRTDKHEFDHDLPEGGDGDLTAFVVFTQAKRGDPHVYAGWLDAADPVMALKFAREHYGQDQQCVNIWVVPREAVFATVYEKDLIWRHTSQDYRLARGYAKDVRRKWDAVRTQDDVREYVKEDLTQTF